MPVNRVFLIGHVGKDPEVRYLESGVSVAKFPLATSEFYKNKNGERVKTTEWHNIVLWRGLAEVAEKFVKKGTMIFIEGKIRSRTWDDKDGNKKYTVEIYGDNMQLLSKKDDTEAPRDDAASNSSKFDDVSPAEDESDDLPF